MMFPNHLITKENYLFMAEIAQKSSKEKVAMALKKIEEIEKLDKAGNGYLFYEKKKQSNEELIILFIAISLISALITTQNIPLMFFTFFTMFVLGLRYKKGLEKVEKANEDIKNALWDIVFYSNIVIENQNK